MPSRDLRLKTMPKYDTVKYMNSISKKEKLNGLQALRGFAFLGIFLGHANVGLKYTSGWQVSAFIVMSGFLLVFNYYDREVPCGFISNIKYSFSKIKRLYPLHLITTLMLFFLFLYFSISDSSTFGTPANLSLKALLNILLVQSFIPINSYSTSLNGVAWYLSTCTFLYFSFPFILKFMKKNYSILKAVVLSALTFVIMIVIAYLTNGWVFAGEDLHNNLTYINPLFRTLDFFIGCNLGYIFITGKSLHSTGWSTAFEIIALICIPLTSLFAVRFYSTPIGCILVSSVLWLPVTLLLVWAFAKGNGYITRALSAKPFVSLGDISNYAFLIHYVVLIYVASLIRFLFNDYSNGYVTAVISLPLSTIASYIYKIIVGRKSS